MDGYVRVSRRLGREGESYISPKVQREAIERWAEYKGVEIAAWHVDEDWSGGTQERPGLEAAIERAVSGQTDGIVAWKIDRFSRYTEGGLRDLRVLEEADARLVFVVEDVDTGGPMGKFVYTVMLAMAEYFLANIKAGWLAAKTRAINRGVHIGPCPIGYRRNEDGTLAVDPDHAGAIAAAFRVAADRGINHAVDFLIAEVPERTWTAFTARRFLGTRTYLGETGYGNNLANPNAHEAIVDRGTFEAVQIRLAQPVPRRKAKEEYPLSGVATCATCGNHMIGGRGGADARRMYRCSRRAKGCAVLSAEPLEAFVVNALRAAFQHSGFRVGGTAVAVTNAEATLVEAEQELDLFASDVDARRLLGERYHRHLADRVENVERARDALREAMGASDDAVTVIPDELWESLEPEELAEVLRSCLDAVIISRGRGPLSERVRVVPKGLDGGLVPGAEDS
jgi:DNA invertase Pin-like site-specific DNA recombinase